MPRVIGFAFPAGDSDGDGYADIVLAGECGTIVEFAGGPSPSSSPRHVLRSPAGAGGYPRFAAADDVDGDGRSDLVIARSATARSLHEPAPRAYGEFLTTCAACHRAVGALQ